MSRRREMEERLGALVDIRDILGAMKNLALMELHKLARLRATQREWTGWLEAAAADATSFHPEVFEVPARTLYVALGSERGFCGDFNERIAEALRSRAATPGAADGPVIAMGRRLWPLLETMTPAPVQVEGASVVEEIEAALGRLVWALDEYRGRDRRFSRCSISIVHHDSRCSTATIAELAPFRRGLVPLRRFGYAAQANEPPAALIEGVAEEYLFAALSTILCESLTAENNRRHQHMGDALHRLDERVAELDLKRSGLRREEITEEIEVILLGADVLEGAIRPAGQRGLRTATDLSSPTPG